MQVNLQEIKCRLYEIAATADPDHHEKGRMKLLRQEIADTIKTVDSMIQEPKKTFLQRVGEVFCKLTVRGI